ncbi:hypothetical protein ACFPVV_10500 [Macrococcoides bohemicum]|uniref:Uncharacterized protein n=1 Tax=Macrococcoides bohemicum TaxID=1903056 RepID=A0A328A3E3_9STAP|nr:hypothetical protein [Macrococcus bohemicus]RAK49045.1 hypothetical protein BHX94_08695 [Macrococcus bohemicus]
MDTHHKEKIKQTILPLYALFFDALPNDLGLSIQTNINLPDMSDHFESYCIHEEYTTFSRMKETSIKAQKNAMKSISHPLQDLLQLYEQPDIKSMLQQIKDIDSVPTIQSKMQHNSNIINKYFFDTNQKSEVIENHHENLINKQLSELSENKKEVFIHLPPINKNNIDILISIFCGKYSAIQFAFAGDNIIGIHIV